MTDRGLMGLRLLSDQVVDNQFELYSVNTDGSSLTQLNGVLLAGRDVSTSRGFVITPDSQKVVYVANEDTLFSETYSVNVDGTGRVRLVSGLYFSQGYYYNNIIINSTGTHMIMLHEGATGITELYCAALDGSSSVKVHPTLAGVQDVLQTDFSGDGQKVIFTGDLDTERITEIYSVDLDGTNLTKLNSPFSFGQKVDRFKAGQSRVVYKANEDSVNKMEYFSVNYDGTDRKKLFELPGEKGILSTDFYITPINEYLLFSGNVDGENVLEFYVLDLSSQ